MATEQQESIQERFESWCARHPDVYEEFKKIACQLLDKRRKRYGAKAIVEVIRYHRAISGADETEPFKVNNNFTSRLARKLVDEDERFTDFFELRELRAA
jgi:hypothetical protein